MTKQLEIANEESSEKSSENLPEQAKEKKLTPGKILRKAREEKKISVDSVAQQLLLSKQIIDDIENDAETKIYSKIAPIYVKGYLRHYAKLVSISEQEILQAYDDFLYQEGAVSVGAPNNSVFSKKPLIYLEMSKVNKINNAPTAKILSRVFFVVLILIVFGIGGFFAKQLYKRAAFVNYKKNGAFTVKELSVEQPNSNETLIQQKNTVPTQDASENQNIPNVSV